VGSPSRAALAGEVVLSDREQEPWETSRPGAHVTIAGARGTITLWAVAGDV
jgi:hypothetical protein